MSYSVLDPSPEHGHYGYQDCGYIAPPPPNPFGEILSNFFGSSLGGSREALTLGTALAGVAEERPLESRTLGGALEEQTLGGTLEARNSWGCSGGVDTWERSGGADYRGALEVRTLGGALEARTLEGALEWTL